MSKMVVLFAHGRTGTHMLRSILAREPWIRNLDEPFNPAVERWSAHSFFPYMRRHLAETGALDVWAAKRLVDGFFDQLEASVGAASGLLDLKVGQIGTVDWPPFLQGTVPVILDSVIARGWPVVICRRHDLLAAYVSQKRAEQTGVWVRRAGKPADDVVQAPFAIDPADMLRHFARQERAAADVDRWLSAYGRKDLIHYEDFSRAASLPDPVREVFSTAFGRPLQRGVKSDTVKLVADHRAAIANPDEVRDALRKAGYARFWPDAADDAPMAGAQTAGAQSDGANAMSLSACDRTIATDPAAAPLTMPRSVQVKDRIEALRADVVAMLKSGVPDRDERHAFADVAMQLGHFDDAFVHRDRRAPFADYRLGGLASFARLMFQARRRDYLTDKGKYRWLIDDKLSGLKFAQSLGLPVVPYILCNAVADVPAALAEMGYPAVIKPLVDADANNVFLVFGPDRVIEHKPREAMDEAAALARMGRTGRAKWLVQRYIGPLDGEGQPVTEIKPYMFYGEVGFVNEVTTYPELAACEWSGDGQELFTGRPINRMKGRGFSPELIADAVRMSLALPAPFLRVDFLVWQGKHYFNEVAPQPGSVGEHPLFDRFLGELYLEAEARLLEDLFNKKPFAEIRALAGGAGAKI